jgi:hypothetical protein
VTTQEPNEDILRKVQGLLNLAAKAGTAEEAAAANAKASELMERYNLSAAMLEKREGKDGKRKQEEVVGGQYQWQRELWASVARLNFCLHWVQEFITVRERTERSTINPNRVYYKGQPVTRKRHALVGRIHNVEATKAMAGYIEQTINRVLADRLRLPNGKLPGDYNGAFGASFREGMADEIMVRLSDRRRKVLAAEARRKKAAASGASSGTALSLTVFIDEETDKNMDFIYGEGYSAEKARKQMEHAQRRKEEQEAYTAWAKANPEEATRQAEEERKRNRRRGGYGSSPRERQKDWGAYRAGSEAGRKVSLDPQVGEADSKSRITGPKVLHI